MAIDELFFMSALSILKKITSIGCSVAVGAHAYMTDTHARVVSGDATTAVNNAIGSVVMDGCVAWVPPIGDAVGYDSGYVFDHISIKTSPSSS